MYLLFWSHKYKQQSFFEEAQFNNWRNLFINVKQFLLSLKTSEFKIFNLAIPDILFSHAYTILEESLSGKELGKPFP